MLFTLIWIIIAVPLVVWGYHLATKGNAQTRRALAILSTCQCPFCGNVFGEQAASEARLRQGALWEVERWNHVGKIVKMTPQWPVVCPQCGAKSGFDLQGGVMVPMDW